MNTLFTPIYLQVNTGHGNARRISLQSCHNDLVALMDADDISVSHRFALQHQAFLENSTLSIVGGQIAEFENNEDNITGIRSVPCTHKEIKSYIKRRCPMNQMSVMFKKTDVEQAGGYQDWYCNEDYFLWIRMMMAGCLFANVPDILVHVRTGKEMASRRGGWRYFMSEAKLQSYMMRESLISLPRYMYNTLLRFGGEVLLPTTLRKRAFKLFRNNPQSFGTQQEKILQPQKAEIKQDKLRTKYPPFSVAMCVYEKDNSEWFDTALESIIVNQTVKPSEVVLVVDGPIPSTLQAVIDKYAKICARNAEAVKDTVRGG